MPIYIDKLFCFVKQKKAVFFITQPFSYIILKCFPQILAYSEPAYFQK